MNGEQYNELSTTHEYVIISNVKNVGLPILDRRGFEED